MKKKLLFSLLATLTTIVFFSCTEKKSSFSLDSGSMYQLRDAELIQVSSHDTTGGNNDRINIHQGETARIMDVEGPGLITRMWFTIDSRDPDFLRNIIIRIYWDGEETPSVDTPVGDFFASPFRYKHYVAENIGMSSGGYYSYFPMPFNKRAVIEITNDTDQEVYAFYSHINYYKLKHPFDENTGYFHAQWNRELRTTGDENYTVLEAAGRGQFVGMHYSGQPYNGSLVYLEGDEMIYVDGESYPSTYGTGMEDYFNSGWYFKDGEFSAPHHGLILLDNETGRVSAYRHHIRDAIPFQDSIRVTLEHGHANEESVDLSTVAFWYQTEPHGPQESISNPGLRKVLRRPVPNDVLEAESLQMTSQMKAEDMSSYGSDWSNNQQLTWSPSEPGNATLTIPNLREYAYDLQIYPTYGPDYGQVTLSADKGKQSWDGYAKAITPMPGLSMENIRTENGTIALNLKVNGKAKDSEGYSVGIDAIKLSPIREYIPEWYMIGPFPNLRNSDTERFGIDTVYPPEEEIDLSATYEGVDAQQIRWKAVDGKPGGYDMGLWNMFQPSDFIITYALTYVYSSEDQTVPLMFSSDDGAKVFVNDEQVYRFLAVNIARPDQFEIELPLKKGWNKVLLKLENNFGGYAFYARFIDPNKELKVSRKKP